MTGPPESQGMRDMSSIGGFFPGKAKEKLVEGKSFRPFCGVMDDTGKLTIFDATDRVAASSGDHALAMMEDAFRKGAATGGISATVVCADARILHPTKPNLVDAILIRLEHVDGATREVFIPYHRNWLGRIKFEEPNVTEGVARVFTHPAGGPAR